MKPSTCTIEHFLDVASTSVPARFFASRSISAAAPATQFVRGDCCRLRLWLCRQVSGQPHEIVAAPGEIVYAIKKNLGDTTFLAVAQNFEPVGSEDGDACYEATLNLHTAEITALFAGKADASVEAVLDIELQNADNTERRTFRRTVTIFPEVYTGTEPPVSAGEQLYPSKAEMVAARDAAVAAAQAIEAMLQDGITFATGAKISSAKDADTGETTVAIEATAANVAGNLNVTGTVNAGKFSGAHVFKGFPKNYLVGIGEAGAAIPLPAPYTKTEADAKINAEAARAKTVEGELQSQIDALADAAGGMPTTLAEYGATLRSVPNATTANTAELADQCAATPLAPASIVAGGVIGNGNVSVAYLRTSFGSGTGVVPDVAGVRDDEKGWFYSNQNAAAWGAAGSKAGTASDAHYYQFTLAAGVGKKVTLTGVAYEWQCAVSDTETNPGTFYTGVFVSTNGGATFARLAPDTASPALPAKGGFMPAAIAVSIPAQIEAASIIVRICFAGGAQAGGHAHFWRNIRFAGITTDDVAGALTSLAARVAALEA